MQAYGSQDCIVLNPGKSKIYSQNFLHIIRIPINRTEIRKDFIRLLKEIRIRLFAFEILLPLLPKYQDFSFHMYKVQIVKNNRSSRAC